MEVSTYGGSLEKAQLRCDSISSTGCNDIKEYLTKIYSNWDTINEILKIDSRPLRFLVEMTPKNINEVEKDTVCNIEKVINDLFLPNSDRDFWIYTGATDNDQQIKNKLDWSIKKVISEKSGIESYVNNQLYKKDSVKNKYGNIRYIVNYHIESINTFKKLIEYKKGECKNWLHWFAVVFKKDYSLEESIEKLEVFIEENIEELLLEPSRLIDNYNNIQDKIRTVKRVYLTYKEVKNTFNNESKNKKNELSDKKYSEYVNDHLNEIQMLNSSFMDSIKKLHRKINVN